MNMTLGYVLLRDRRVPIRIKLIALAIGAAGVGAIELLQLPVEGVVAALFTYHMTPATISITSNGRCRSVGLEAVLRKIEYWHQAPVTKFRIMARQGKGAWHGVRWTAKRQHLSH